MIKKYNDFILENFSSKNFEFDYNQFMDIYQNKIVPSIGEVEVFTNFMLNDVLDKSEEANFHKLRNKLKDSRNEFADSIKSLSERFFKSSFSSLAQNINSNPEEDVDEMQKILNRAGFTIEILKKLFNPVVSVFTSESFARFIDSNNLDDENGYVDIYLYKLNEKLDLNTTVWLGGLGWGDALNDNPEEEYVVKYSYGYHKTPYGKLFLEQIGITKDEFITTTYQYLRDHFRESVYPGIISDLKKMAQIGYASSIMDFKMDFDKYVTLDDDRFIINYVEMCNYFNEVTENKYENSATPEWFKETILSNMRTFSDLNIQDTGDDLIFND
jgi:hypothetical protein